ncbi:MAG: PEGA domain-containing protein [Myxococcota bacterium]
MAVLVAASAAWGQKEVVVAGAGACDDAALIIGAKEIRDAARADLKGTPASLMDEELIFDMLRPRPARAPAELAQQLDSARTLFYEGQSERAAGLIERVLSELERAEPGPEVWPTTSTALALRGLVSSSLGRSKELADDLRAILRVEPGFKLDPQQYPPSALAALETARKELARAKKSRTSIRVDSGPEGTVFLDGRAMGKTPVELELLPGEYRVMLADGARVSFPRRLVVPSDRPLSIDFGFEGSVRTQTPLCIEGESDSSALKLAHLVAAERLIVVRNVAKRGEPTVLTGTLYELSTGKQERQGRVFPGQGASLARFLLFGKELTAPAPAPSGPAPKTSVSEVSASSAPTRRWAALAPLIGGGVMSVTGVVMIGSANGEAAALKESTEPAPTVFRQTEALEARGNVGGVLLGLGLAAAITGGVLLALPMPVQPTVSVGPSGASLGVSGAFP